MGVSLELSHCHQAAVAFEDGKNQNQNVSEDVWFLASFLPPPVFLFFDSIFVPGYVSGGAKGGGEMNVWLEIWFQNVMYDKCKWWRINSMSLQSCVCKGASCIGKPIKECGSLGLQSLLEGWRVFVLWGSWVIIPFCCSAIRTDWSCRKFALSGMFSMKFQILTGGCFWEILFFILIQFWSGRDKKYFSGNAYKNTALCLDQIYVAVARSQKWVWHFRIWLDVWELIFI